jgi:hypothetical protein
MLLLPLLLPAAAAGRVETVFRALHSLVPGHGDWQEVAIHPSLARQVVESKAAYLAERALGGQYDPDSLPYFKFIPK